MAPSVTWRGLTFDSYELIHNDDDDLKYVLIVTLLISEGHFFRYSETICNIVLACEGGNTPNCFCVT